MYCNPLHSGTRAGPIPAAPSFPRMPPPPAAVQVPITGTAPSAVLLCPDPTAARAVVNRVSSGSDGSTHNNNHNNYTNNCYTTTTTDNNNNNPNNKVSFRDIRMEVRVVSLACLSEELRNDIWYSQSDIEGMRTEARDLCRFLRVNPQAYPPEHTRGLELRISLERQCRKQLTVQGVVEAQRRCTDPVVLANLAQRCSMVPKEMALAQAQRDYCMVYTATTTTNNNANCSINHNNEYNHNNTQQAQQGQMSNNMRAQASVARSASAVPRYNNNRDSKMPAGMAHPSANNHYNNNNNYHRNHNNHQNMPNHQNMGYGGYHYNNNHNHSNHMNGMMACPQQYPPYPTSSSNSYHHMHSHHHQPTEPQHHQGANLEFCMQQQQQHLSQLSLPPHGHGTSMDSFEPIPLSTAGAVAMPPDDSMALLEAVAVAGQDGNTKRTSFELFAVEDNPQARMVRPRLGGYPAA